MKGVYVVEMFGIDRGDRPFDEMFATQNNNFIVGGSETSVWECYVYTATGITIANGTPTPSLGETPVIVGGADPNIIPGFTSSGPGHVDWPVQIKTI